MGLKECRTPVTLYRNKNLSRWCPRDRALIAQEIIKLSSCITVKMQRRTDWIQERPVSVSSLLVLKFWPKLRPVFLFYKNSSVWQNLAFEDRIRMASQGDFRSSKALLTNQKLRLKQQRQQIVDGLSRIS